MSLNRWLRECRAIPSRTRRLCRRPASDNRRSAGFRLESLEDRCVPASSTASIAQAYGQLPLGFEVNRGQADAAVSFLSRGDGYGLYLTPSAAVLDLSTGSAAAGQPSDDQVLTVQLVGSNAAARPVGLDLQPGVSNYLIGNDPSQWVTNVAHYGRAEFQNVYPGVNLVYYGNDQQHLEYDFVLAPGADPGAIRLSFQGAQGVTLNRQGDLVLHTAGGDLVEQAPVAYQTVDGARQAVSSRFVLAAGNQVAFQIGAYDATRPLVIDPTYSLVYSTYIGGNSAIAVDGAGDAYITGIAGNVFSTRNAFQKNSGGFQDAFVTKLNPAGTALIYSTYLGGRYHDAGTGIAVDASGNAYVTGRTASDNFPTKNAFQPTKQGAPSSAVKYSWDAFVAKLNPSGSALLYSSYLGGSGDETSDYGIAVDNSGNAFVSGWTPSADFPTTTGAYRTSFTTTGASDDGFVTKLNTTLAGAQSLVYSTFLGGLVSNGIALDGAGNAYVGGEGGGPGNVVKLKPDGSGLAYSSLVGGNVDAIAVDATGDAYVTGFAPRQGVLVTKLDTAGSQVYSLTFGGSDATGTDRGEAIAVDSAGNAYVTGSTSSPTFPTVNAIQSTYGGGLDAFVTVLADPSQPGGTPTMVFSSYLGGSDLDRGDGIAVDGGGNVYVTGYASGGFPTTAGSFEPIYPYHGQHPSAVGFVAKIGVQSTPGATPSSSPSGGADPLAPPATAPTSPMALPAGADLSDLAGVMPLPWRPVTPFTSTAGFTGTGLRTALALESVSPPNAAISPIVCADADIGRRPRVLQALAADDAIDDGPADWLVAPVTLGGEVN
jgi:hypothetical protein